MPTPTVSRGFLHAAYGDTPWEDFDKNQRTVFVPELLEAFRFQSVFYRMVTYGVNLFAQRTAKMVFTQVLDPDPNIAELQIRQIWLPQIYMDSRQLEITARYYGDKIMMHKYDDAITYWRENGSRGLRPIISKRLAPHMVQSLDLLARNAYLNKYNTIIEGGRASFEDLVNTDTYDVGVHRAVHLGADYQPDPVDNPIICITSPSAIYTIRSAESGEWLERQKYTTNVTVNYEVGMYEGIRMSRHPVQTLWNCGQIVHRAEIQAAVNLGDGAPDPATEKVEGVWMVGQTAGQTHYIDVDDCTGFEVGDVVSLHRHIAGDTSQYDTELYDPLKATDGCLFNDSTKVERTIYSITPHGEGDEGYIAFTEPIMTDSFSEEMPGNGGHYGYVTLGRTVHAAVFNKGPRGVVAGVIQPPQTYTPAPIDDVEGIYRFSWDARLRYQQMYPNRFEVYFFTGPVRRVGEVVQY